MSEISLACSGFYQVQLSSLAPFWPVICKFSLLTPTDLQGFSSRENPVPRRIMPMFYYESHEKVSAPTTPGQAEGCVDVALQSHAPPAPPQTDQAEGARDEEEMSPSPVEREQLQKQRQRSALSAL